MHKACLFVLLIFSIIHGIASFMENEDEKTGKKLVMNSVF